MVKGRLLNSEKRVCLIAICSERWITFSHRKDGRGLSLPTEVLNENRVSFPSCDSCPSVVPLREVIYIFQD